MPSDRNNENVSSIFNANNNLNKTNKQNINIYNVNVNNPNQPNQHQQNHVTDPNIPNNQNHNMHQSHMQPQHFNMHSQNPNQIHMMQGVFTHPHPQQTFPPPVSIECITKVCNFLNLTLETDPLWYIFHPLSHSSYGPVTTQQLIDTCKLGMASSITDVRLVDMYSIKGFKPYNFFKLQMVEREDFVDFIEDSKYLQNTEMYKHVESGVAVKEQLKVTENENHKLKEKLASLELEFNLLKELNRYNLQKKLNEEAALSKQLTDNNNNQNTLKELNQQGKLFNNSNKSTSHTEHVVVKQQFADPDQEEQAIPQISTKHSYNSNQQNANDDNTGFEKIKKKRPGQNTGNQSTTNKEPEQFFTLSQPKPVHKSSHENTNKYVNKVDLIGGDELVDLLKPKTKNVAQASTSSTSQQNLEPEKDMNAGNISYVKNKKGKNKPMDLNVKLGILILFKFIEFY